MKSYKKLIIILIIIFLLIGGIFFLKGGDRNKTLLTPGLELKKKLSATPTTTPLPKIIIDQNSNLEEELKKLTPDDFSSDLDDLKQEVFWFLITMKNPPKFEGFFINGENSPKF